MGYISQYDLTLAADETMAVNSDDAEDVKNHGGANPKLLPLFCLITSVDHLGHEYFKTLFAVPG